MAGIATEEVVPRGAGLAIMLSGIEAFRASGIAVVALKCQVAGEVLIGACRYTFARKEVLSGRASDAPS